ncbi:SPFH domain-containing protein [Streptomyces sp. NPDC056883]|uniref:SPFH domain-containing protein n=1 Tax=Streptomyces sp. NPDC056883 TaxID=3345959 RepID=UPI0036D0563B
MPVAAGRAAAESGAERGSHLSGEHDRAASGPVGPRWGSVEAEPEAGRGADLSVAAVPVAAGRAAAESGAERGSYLSGGHDGAGSVPAGSEWVSAEAEAGPGTAQSVAAVPVAAGWAAAESGAEPGSRLSGEHDRAGSVPVGSGWGSAEAEAGPGSRLSGEHDRAGSVSAGSGWVSAEAGAELRADLSVAAVAVGAGRVEGESGAEQGSYLSGEHERAGSGRDSVGAGAERGAGLAGGSDRAASPQAAAASGVSGGAAAGPFEVVSAAVSSGPSAVVTEWAGSTGWALAPERTGPVGGPAEGGREADGLVAVGTAAQASSGAPHGPVGRVGEAARSDVPAARAQAEPGVDIPHPQDEAAHAGAATLRLRNPDAEAARPHPQDEAWPPGVSLAAATARAEHGPRHAGPPAAWDLPGQGGSSAEQGRAPQHAVPGPAPEAEYADPYPVRDLPEPGDAGPADPAGRRELTWSVPAPGTAGDADLVGGSPAGNGRPGREAADGRSATGVAARGGAADGEAVGFVAATGVAARGEAADGEAVGSGPASGGAATGGAADGEAVGFVAATGVAATGVAADGEVATGGPATGVAASAATADSGIAFDPQDAETAHGIVPGPGHGPDAADGAEIADGADITEVVARAVARIAEDDTQDLPRVTAARGVAVTEVPVHLPFRGAAHPQPKRGPEPKPKAGEPKARAAAPTRSAPGRRVPRGDDRLHEHRGPVLPGWIAVAVGGIALAGCAVVLWRAGAVPDSLALAFGAEPRPYRGLQARFWPPLAFLGVVALLALGGLGRGRAGHAWVLTLFGRYRGTVRRTGLTWISPLLLRRRVDVRLRHWRSDPMPAVDSGGLALQVVVQVVWQVKDTARATLAVEDHVDYLAEQVESAMARVLSQLPADAFHEDAPTLRDAEAVGDALTRMLASETEAVGVEVFSAQPTRIEYAPEVADAMRRRRVAAIDAKHRDTVLTSVVDAVDDTVHRLTSRGIVELDDYERKALVKDLTVAFYTGRSE